MRCDLAALSVSWEWYELDHFLDVYPVTGIVAKGGYVVFEPSGDLASDGKNVPDLEAWIEDCQIFLVRKLCASARKLRLKGTIQAALDLEARIERFVSGRPTLEDCLV